jgi:hypothetical protein
MEPEARARLAARMAAPLPRPAGKVA